MSIFDTIAENRYREWLENKDDEDHRAAIKNTPTPNRQSFESSLFLEINRVFEKAAKQTNPVIRKKLIDRASAMETQLLISLEKKSMPLLAVALQDSIAHQRRVLNNSKIET